MHADDLGVGRGVHHREAQRAGLEALQVVGAHELEALAERAAMLLDRHPQRRIGRVVDHHHAFEIRIFEPRDRVERLLQHLRRLAIGRDVDRDFRRVDRARAAAPATSRSRLAAERDRRDLFDAREGDDDQRDQEQRAEAERKGRARHEIVAVPVGEDGREPGADNVGGAGQQHRLSNRRAGHRQDRQRQQHRYQQRDAGQPPVIGIGDRAGPVELRRDATASNMPQ